VVFISVFAIEGGGTVGVQSVREETDVDGMLAGRGRSAAAVSRGRRWIVAGERLRSRWFDAAVLRECRD